jgi:hypothetical protein
MTECRTWWAASGLAVLRLKPRISANTLRKIARNFCTWKGVPKFRLDLGCESNFWTTPQCQTLFLSTLI